MNTKALIYLSALLAVASATSSLPLQFSEAPARNVNKKWENVPAPTFLKGTGDDCVTIYEKCGYAGANNTYCSNAATPISFDFAGSGFSVYFGDNVFALNIYIGDTGAKSIFETSVCVSGDFVGVSVEVYGVSVSVVVGNDGSFLKKSYIMKKISSARKMKELN
mmetsp:Transcript_59617/g.67813  ORF Transcript_59617/g.67813 Transcript_59617/m.67813 type:complete len:164 (-) Transcript_59617:146-637(-)